MGAHKGRQGKGSTGQWICVIWDILCSLGAAGTTVSPFGVLFLGMCWLAQGKMIIPIMIITTTFPLSSSEGRETE